MPRTKTAERAARVAEIKRQQNRSLKSSTKTSIDRANESIQAKDLEKSQIAVKRAISKLDKAVKGKIMHPNTAARRKSNLMRKLNVAYGIQSLPPRQKARAKKSTTKKTTSEK